MTAVSSKAGTTPVYASYTVTVVKEKATVQAGDAQISFGGEFTGTYLTIVGESGTLGLSDFSGTLYFKTQYKAGMNVGAYSITPYGLTSDKYDITYEPGTLTVVPRTLTADNFTVTAKNKTYDGTADAFVTAAANVSGVTATAEGAFLDANAGKNKTVEYKITSIAGSAAANYVLEGGEITGTAAADIEKVKVKIFAPDVTYRTYSGSAESTDVSATADGRIFTDYTVTYSDSEGNEVTPVNVGVYNVLIKLSDSANYELLPYAAKLEIRNASQDSFMIDGIPAISYYGDEFALTADTDGTVTYTVTGADFDAATSSVRITKPGKVTVTATSSKPGFADKTAERTFTAYKKAISVKVSAIDKIYDGATDVSFGAPVFTGTVSGDSVTADITGKMLNSDAGENKIVYADVSLSGNWGDYYTLDADSVQTTVNVAKAKITGIKITAADKAYDGTRDANAKVTAIYGVLPIDEGAVKVTGTAAFDNVNAGIRTVFFDAEEIIGAKGANYEFESGTAKIATYIAQINKLKVKIFVSAATNRTYSGDPEYVDVSANAGGKVFTDFTLLYEDENGNAKEPIAPGTYNVKVVLNDETNYETEPYTAQLVIKSASQSSFTIDGIPETVYYGDEFDVSTDSDGEVHYTVTGNAEVDSSGHVKVTGTGKITLEAVSSKEGFADKSVKRTFTANKKVISSEITAENRTYDGTSGVNIDSVQLIGTLPTDSVTASATGAMLNSDAGDNKTVYAKVTLDGNWGEVYALDTESVQTTVDIKKALITGIKITAQDKKYSKTDDALVRVDEITGVLAMDASLVRVSGEAKFDTASAGDNKTVTFIATELTGRKAANYEFESPDAMQAMAEASITPLNVTFTLGALTFGYDTDEKPVTVSAFDETGAVFTDYDIVYRDADGNDLGFVPKDAGSYLVGIEITDSNYVTDYTDKEMFIIEADQEALSILGLPGTVAFGDEFTLEAIGGSGTGRPYLGVLVARRYG